MLHQFLGKPFWVTLGGLAALFGASLLVFDTPVAPFVLAALAIGVFALTLYKLEWGIMAAFAELFANSHGHLISAEVGGFSLSLRMVVFLSVMAAWALLFVARKTSFTVKDPRLTPFIALAAAIGVGFVVGFAENDRVNAFKDGNGYLYVLYLLPILSVHWTGRTKRLLLQVLCASAAWVSIVTLGLLYIFTHFPEWVLGPVYTFIRDTRTGELTKMIGQIFRIFLQAQISVVAVLFLLSPFFWVQHVSKKERAVLLGNVTIIMMVILISLSRSFWVGMIAGGIAFLLLVAYYLRPTPKQVFTSLGFELLALPLAGVALVLVILFPLPYRVGSTGDLTALFSARATDTGDVAISSRWNLLPPLLDEIKHNPLLGSGFGEEVTFKTDDPRARAINPDGTWTTYALEWGWLEIWLKMGIFGIFAFTWLFVSFVRGLWPLLMGDHAWLGIALLCNLVMLYATHVFSPYLNHPLGLGLLLFMVPFIKTNLHARETEPIFESILPNASVQTSVATIRTE